MALFFSPFRWIWLILGIIVVSILAIAVISTVYFGFVLGHAIIFGPPRVFAFPFFGLGFLFLGVIIVGLFLGFLFRPFRRRMYYSNRWYRYDTAMDSLRQRYARGEITRDQFEQMAGDLERHR
jgi:putative membrane protein